MKNAVLSVIVSALCFFLCNSSQAATILSISPDTQIVNAGSIVSFDVNISGLGSGIALGGFDLDIGFNSTLLSFNQAHFGGTSLGDQLDLANSGLNSPAATPSSGLVNLFEFSIDSPATLMAQQAKSFTLAVLSFNALTVGSSPITFSVNGLTDVNANDILYSTQNGTVTINAGNGIPSNAVPEPSAILLLMSGGLASLLSRRRNRFNSGIRLKQRSIAGMIGTLVLALTMVVILPFPAPVFAVTTSSCELPDGDIDGDECITQNPSKNNGGNNPDCNSCAATAGDPIDIATGNKYENEVDYSSSGSSPLLLRRSYNSNDTGTSSFGVSWRGAYSRTLSAVYYGLFVINGSYQYKNAVDATRDDGKILTFYQNGSQWLSDSDVNSRLIKLASGWQYTSGLDEIEIYNANGQLTSVTDRAGLTQTLSYNTQGRLATVSNPFGRSLAFAYTGANVTTVTVPNGGVYSYSYDTHNNLSTVTYPDKTQRKFVYENTAYPHALTGVIDENANRYSTDTYDSAGRDISNQLAGGVNKYTLDYSYLTYGYVPVKDALGVTRTLTFTNINQVALETLMSQSCPSCPAAYTTSKTTTTYDGNGNIASQTDFNGNTTNYSYDTTRNLQISRTEAAGKAQARTTTTTWHPIFRLPVKIVEPTKTTAFSYDAKGNLLQKTVSAGPQTKTWTYTYNANSQPLTLDGPRTDVNDVTRFSYDSQGNLSSITDALGHITSITAYNADGLPLTMKDANGLLTSFQYDARNRLISSSVGAETTGYSYDAAGQLIKLSLPDASYLAYSYDTAHRLIKIADSQGNHIDYSLDLMGNRLKTQTFDPANTLIVTRSQVFDGLSRLAKAIGAQNQITQLGYDANGNTTSVGDPLNNKTNLTYDPLNRLIGSIDPLGKTTRSTYDSNDNPLALTDPLNHTTGYGYDGFGQKLTTTSPDSGQSQNSYDAAGNLISSVDARGQTVNYSYDALNRVSQIIYANKPPINFSYDQGVNGLGHLTQMTEGYGATVTTWSYDVHGRVSSKAFRSGTLLLVTAYGYDAAGRLATITYPSGKVVQIGYDSNGQISQLAANGSPLISSIHYQAFGSAKSWQFGNGITTSRSFDQDGRLIAYDLGNRSRQLAYDAVGRISGYTDSDLNHDQGFSYDALGRLIAYSDPFIQTQYSYDANGNRVQVNGTPVNHYNTDIANNRLLSITDSNNQPVKNYSYDASGNLINDGYNTFTYDGRGRLVQAANVSLGVEQYLINGLGQRTGKVYGNAPDLSGDANQDGILSVTDTRLIVLMTQGSVPVSIAADCNHDGKVTVSDASCVQAKILDMRQNPGKYVQAGTYFVYDGAGHLQGEYSQTGAPIQETVWLGNTPIAILAGSSQYYVYADHLNAPRAISDNTGTVIWRWDSEAFGTTVANEDPDKNGVAFTYNLRFPGQYYDKSTGLHYNGFRDYNPAIGRYIENDPIGLSGGANTYAYARNNPLSYIDPKGLCIEDLCIGEIIFLAYLYSEEITVGTIIATEIASGVPNPVSVEVSAAAQIASKANAIHSSLDPIAQSMRTTAVLRTATCDIAAGGARDLTAAQRAVAQSIDATTAAMPGAHAEVTAITSAQQQGLIPQLLEVTRDICPACAAFIESTGGTVTGPRSAQWP